jgi:hypothetical protein
MSLRYILLLATCFSPTGPSSGNTFLIEPTALCSHVSSIRWCTSSLFSILVFWEFFFWYIIYWQSDYIIYKSMCWLVYRLTKINCTLFVAWEGKHPVTSDVFLSSLGLLANFFGVCDFRAVVEVVEEVGLSGFLVCCSAWCCFLW